jgi:hypothetical protein
MKHFFLFLIFFSTILFAQVPQKLSYQGILTDQYGVIVADNIFTLTFRLYSTESGGTPVWEESQSVQVTGGIFNAILGKINPLNISFSSPYYLGITVAAGSELIPRIEMTSTGYSLISKSVVDNAVTSAKIMDGAVTQEKLAPGITLPPDGSAGGDLSGTFPNPTVSKLKGRALSNTDPSSGQLLGWSGSLWEPVTLSGLPPGGSAGGDLSGTFPNPTVSKLSGRALSNTEPTSGQLLGWSGTLWEPVTLSGLPPGGTAGGDLSGTFPNPTVSKIGGRALSNTAPTSGQLLGWSGTLWEPVTLSGLPPGGTAGGDLSGTFPNPTVSKISGRALSNTAPSPGQVLGWSGTLWEPVTQTVGLGGSGTIGTIPIFTSSNVVGNSLLTTGGFALNINTNDFLGLGFRISRSNGGLGFSLLENGQPSGKRGWIFVAMSQQLKINAAEDDGFTPVKSLITFDREGRVGIGTENPGYPLHVAGSLDTVLSVTGSKLSQFSDIISVNYIGQTGMADVRGITSRSVVNPGWGIGGEFTGGWVGLRATGSNSTYTGWGCGLYGTATGSDGARFGVVGSAFAAGGVHYGVYADGNLGYTGSLINASDAKLKNNITPLTNVIDRIKKLEPKIYSYSDSPEYRHMNLPEGSHYGLIAQDLEKVFPEMVVNTIHPSVNEKREGVSYKGVTMMEMIPVLIQAIKEQQQKIEDLEKTIADLKK